MKYLVMGDIHGNLIALEKVLKIYKNEVDIIICHGDVVNYGPWSNECVDILDDIGAVCLQGNHEYAFLNGSYGGNNELVHEFFGKTYPSFKKQVVIKEYKLSYSNDYFNVIHTINRKYFFPDSIIDDLSINSNTIIGHSHYSFIRLTNTNYYLINTGSIGQNRKNLNIIEFCVYDSKTDKYEIKQILYDAGVVINQMIAENYPPVCINYYKSKMH